MAKRCPSLERKGMKINSFSKLSLVAVACALIANAGIKAQNVQIDPVSSTVGKQARLIVMRDASFGLNEVVDLFVDGTKVAALGYNESYEAALPVGKHVLAISTDPKTYSEDEPTRIAINAKPGETYSFTAVWPDSERAGLVAN